MVRGKRGQTIGSNEFIALLIALGILVLVIWGFTTNWWGIGNKGAIYVGGSGLNELSDVCKLSCQSGTSATYCHSDIKTVNKLEGANMLKLKSVLTTAEGVSFGCFGKDKKTALGGTDFCGSKKEGYWLVSNYIEELNFYSSQAKVTCNTLAQAGLIDACDNAQISCA